jgi:heterodisulfide reductase subunit C
MIFALKDIPQGTEILRCLQCGTCSASCPLTDQMDFTPRALFALIRDGDMEAALSANTAWFCVSCYQCMVRCPQEIPITDLMYRLKQLAMEKGTVPKSHRMPDLYRAFGKIMARDGRISEALVMAAYGIRHPIAAFENSQLGLALLKRGRLDLLPRRLHSANALSAQMTGVGYRKEKP